ncbi:heme ABC exporter ATP-binding protein CcmA [Sphingomonas sp. ID0503]|uniref:heme ABC exporter ATP-binding protein CcmA n=1 Tax=Sphingomonas sp. ID0503 TaxID=3399691 RepID=UPI003AFB6D96
MTRLSCRGLAALRGDRLLFDGLDLEVQAGGAVIVTGPNGAGKSTLLRIIAGLLPPSAGRVKREGAVALTGEGAALDEDRPLFDALMFWARIDGRDDHDVRRGLDAMGIGGLADAPVRYLSTGQRRRAAIARTIVSGAPIWLLDEPANGLDAIATERLIGAIGLHRGRGGIAVIATHQPLPLTDARPLVLGAW